MKLSVAVKGERADTDIQPSIPCIFTIIIISEDNQSHDHDHHNLEGDHLNPGNNDDNDDHPDDINNHPDDNADRPGHDDDRPGHDDDHPDDDNDKKNRCWLMQQQPHVAQKGLNGRYDDES